jgi:small-conductance mechanosensitive channel
MTLAQIILQEPRDLIIQAGAIIISLLVGAISTVISRRLLHFDSPKLHSIFFHSKFPVFFFAFLAQCTILPVISFLLGSASYFIQLVLFIQATFMASSLLKACFKNRYIRFFGELTAWILTTFQALGLLKPSVTYLQSVNFQLGSVKISLFGMIKALLSTGFLIYGANVFSNYLSKKLKRKKHLQLSMQLLISKIIKTLLMICSVFIGLSLLGIDLSVFSIFAGAIGVGVAFSLQNIFSNYFSGFIILMDRSIKPGDVISLDEGKTYGIVNKLHARYVSIRTREGKEHLIPNQLIISNKLENWSYSDPHIRMEILFRISYDSNLPLAEKLLVSIAQKTNRVKEDPSPYVRFRSLVDNAVDLKLRVWVEDPENGTSGIQSDIIVEAWKAFRKHGIRIPYPPREIYSKHPSSLLEGALDLQN